MHLAGCYRLLLVLGSFIRKLMTCINLKRVLLLLIIYTAAITSFAQQKNYNFSEVDKIIEEGIRSSAFPSAVLVVGNSKGIIYQNAYGRLTYNEGSAVTTLNTIYDLASVTKVIAATAAIMILYDEGKLDIYDYVYKYIPEFNNNGKEDITIFNLLVHNSGLTAWTPFYQNPDLDTPQKVKNAVFNCTKEYPTGTRTLYSDYNAFLLGEIAERISKMRLDKFCKEKIFKKLNMRDTDYLIPESEDYRIAPTEQDTYWRNQLLIGYVHDEFAAVLEGISGNAGLFSTGPDLFKFMQMMLNKGRYTDVTKPNPVFLGDTLFKEYTVDLFTSKVTGLGYNNTRALGWETKPEPTKYPPQCGNRFSSNCFGHTGYTGTSVWCDKDKDLIVIFLTNRVHPTRNNDQIREIRPKVHDEICKALGY